jgi:hypothetical protein
MLPEKLSTDLTSLGEEEERLAIVVDMVVAADGGVTSSDVYRAAVVNRAKLTTTGRGLARARRPPRRAWRRCRGSPSSSAPRIGSRRR